MTSFVFWCTLLVVGVKAANNAAGGFDYGNAVHKSFLFFEAQRSGRLPFNQRVKWRADSGLRDGFPQGVSLSLSLSRNHSVPSAAQAPTHLSDAPGLFTTTLHSLVQDNFRESQHNV